MSEIGTLRVKTGLAEMLKGGVIMDVVDAEQARIAEDAGACAVMALERVPADIRRDGGVARMSDPEKIREIQEAVSIPVMAKCRIGHFVEAQILEALEVDYIDESEVLTPADVEHHVDKHAFTVPFVCGATNLGEALRRIAEGAAMIRTKGEAGTGDIVNAVTHMRSVFGAIRGLAGMREEELYAVAKDHSAPYELVRWVAENGRLPVVTFTAGGIATPADAALCMQLGADGVFVGSGIFKSGDPDRRARAIVEATTHFEDAKILADVSAGLGEPMVGISASTLPKGSGSKFAAGSAAPRGKGADLHFVPVWTGSSGSAFSPCRALFASTCRHSAVPAQRSSRCACRSSSTTSTDSSSQEASPRRWPDLQGSTVWTTRSGHFGRPILGTCAGMILVDRAHLGLADLEVARNAYGRQVASFEADLDLGDGDRPFRGVFIRAPRVRDVGPGVEVLAQLDGEPVLLRDGGVLVASFHPELTHDPRIHERFLELVTEATSVGA